MDKLFKFFSKSHVSAYPLTHFQILHIITSLRRSDLRVGDQENETF